MTSEWRSGRGVSERDGQSDHPRGTAGTQSPRVANMIAADVLGRVAELSDGTGRLRGHRHGGGNRSISQIPAKMDEP
jgi:hypothetical protein